MSNDVKLTIELPTGIFLEKNVPGVLLPAVRAPIEVLPERAPSVFVLDYGVIEVTGRGADTKEKYFIYPGMADVAQNHCKIMTQAVVAASSVNVNSAKELAENAKDDVERLFYQMIVDHLRGVRKRYLRTLKVFAKKSGRLVFKK